MALIGRCVRVTKSCEFPFHSQLRTTSSSRERNQGVLIWPTAAKQVTLEQQEMPRASPYQLLQNELGQVHRLIREASQPVLCKKTTFITHCFPDLVVHGPGAFCFVWTRVMADGRLPELRRHTNLRELSNIAQYYFDGQGKSLRPMLVLLMSEALNYHKHASFTPLRGSQRQVAMISEMVHTASLIHDDVIDQSNLRRGKPSINLLWREKEVAHAGSFIMAVSQFLIARINNNEVTLTSAQVLSDLVKGEFIQMGSAQGTENKLFSSYLTKSYCKTGSLIANYLKMTAILAGVDAELSTVAHEYGRHVGVAFQLVDDALDFEASSEALGKPAGADLQLGLATAPVLFARHEFPELDAIILRRFAEKGDAELAYSLVRRSKGLEQTRLLANQHCIQARRLASRITPSPYQQGLLDVSDLMIMRSK